MNKKVLIITYYWPPSGGSGVQRWLKHAKYLREAGWEPIICTAKDAAYPVRDETLEREVPADLTIVRTPIWEPYSAYRAFVGAEQKVTQKKSPTQPGWLAAHKETVAQWIRANVFVPDGRRFWIRPAVRFLRDYLAEHPVDAMISTGPPHSTHLIALQLKREFSIPWLVDYRDPWTQIYFYDQLSLLPWVDRQHRRLEREVLQTADRVCAVSWHWANDLKRIRENTVDVITNGFDEADFSAASPAPALRPHFEVCHLGFLSDWRNADELWLALKECADEDSALRAELRIRLIGKIDPGVRRSIERCGLATQLELVDQLPHAEAIRATSSSPILLLVTLLSDKSDALGVIPGKVFEYLAARRPILAIGMPGSDSERILAETQAGIMVDYRDRSAIKREVQRLFAQYQKGQLTVSASDNLKRFSRRTAAHQVATVLTEMVR